MASNQTASSGIGCLSVIGVVFVTLKVLGVPPVASWSWLWVLSPWWIGIALVLTVIILVVAVMGFIGFVQEIMRG